MTFFTKQDSMELVPKMESTKATLGSKIAELRKKKGFTQEEFAEKLGVTAQAVSKWENDVSCPDIMLLPKIAEIFSVSIDELMGVKTNNKDYDTNTTNTIEPKLLESRSKLKLRIQIIDVKNNRKPVNIAVPVNFVTKIARTGLKISSIVGGVPDNLPIEKILEQVNNGVSGEILDMTADDGTQIKIEIS